MCIAMRRKIRFTNEYKQSVTAPKSDPGRQVDDFLNTIFVRDPDTGFPCNDLSWILNKNTRPEVAEYIRTRLQQVIPSLPKTSAEDAEALSYRPGMTVAQYKDQIRDYIRGLQLRDEVNEK